MDPGTETLCIFCSAACDQVSSLNPINENQARSLWAVLGFECSGGVVLPKYSEATFLNTYPCPTCVDWVSEAESIVEEWELILDKIRAIASHLKQVMSRTKLGSKPTQREGTNSHEDPKRRKTEPNDMIIEESVHEFVETHYDADPAYLFKVELEFPERDPLGPTEFSTPILPTPSGDMDVIVYENLMGSETDMLKSQPESESISASDWAPSDNDDPDAEEFEDVPNLKIPAPRTRSRNPRRQDKILQQPDSSYMLETCGGPVKLQHCQIEIQRCDDPSLVVNFSSRYRHSSKVSPRTFHSRETLNRLRQRAQRRQDTRQNVKRGPGRPRKCKLVQDERVKRGVGRPAKYKLLQGTDELCPNYPHCTYRSTDPDKLSGHFRDKHLRDPFPYRCNVPDCEKAYKCFGYLAIHRDAHRGHFRFNCKECGKLYKTKTLLNHHVLVNHTENPRKFACDQCEQKCFTPQALRSHIQSVHETNPRLRCTIVEGCEATFKAKPTLRRHQRSAHPEKFPHEESHPSRKSPIMCEECGITFARRDPFKRHMLKHQGVPIEVLRPHACPHEGCGYRSPKRADLLQHIEVVHAVKERTVKCSHPTCEVRFKNEKQARHHFKWIHLRKSTKGHPCPFCPATLSSLDALREHITKCEPKDVPDTNTVQCDLCNKYLSNALVLKRHKAYIHNSREPKPWECGRCGKTFALKQYLQIHAGRETRACAEAMALRNMNLSTSPSDLLSSANKCDKLEPTSDAATAGVESTLDMGQGQSSQLTNEESHEGNPRSHILLIDQPTLKPE